jgi:hypothetical protein
VFRFLRRLFPRTTPGGLEPAAFQVRVLAILRREFQRQGWRPNDDPMIVESGESQLGLQNVYAEYRRLALDDGQLEEAVVAHFARSLRNSSAGSRSLDWAEAESVLRLQLVPAEYSDRPPILEFPFHHSVVATAVCDLPEGYAIVTSKDVERWQVSRAQVYAAAEANLQAASRDLEVQSFDGPNRCIAVQSMDGYDAARALLPGFRRFLGDRLGSPFFVAVPNRDFLVAWAADCEPAFDQFMREKAVKDFGERPYPLVSEVFRADADTVRPWSA